MIKNIASKLTKPKTPESLEELLAAGGRIVFNVPVTDEKGRALAHEEVREIHTKSARMQIASYEQTVSNAAGLRPLAVVEADLATRQAETRRAVKHWQLMQRRYNGGMAELSEVEKAQCAFNEASAAYHPVMSEHSKIKAAIEAQEKIDSLRKEYKL